MYKPFNCSENSRGDPTNSVPFNFSVELKATFNSETRELDCLLHPIDGRLYQTNLILLEGEVLFNIARKTLRQLEDNVLEGRGTCNTNSAGIRTQIVTLLSMCRNSLQDSPSTALQNDLLKRLKVLRNSMRHWKDLSSYTLSKLMSKSVRDDQLSIYHYFHLYLDIQWLTLSIIYICNGTLDIYKDILDDLMISSRSLFTKKNERDNLTDLNPFVCPCIKNLWILLQMFNEKAMKANRISDSFWGTFTEILKNEGALFSLWLLNNVAVLQGYSESGEVTGSENPRVCDNYDLLNSVLKDLNSQGVYSNEVLLTCFKLIDPLLNTWWCASRKSEPYQILWEIFARHLNTSFDTLKDVTSGIELVEIQDAILHRASTTDSYNYFLFMLAKYLKASPNQWTKIRGRIYTKFPPNKINDLEQTGLLKVTLLFLCLASTVNTEELTSKLISLLANLTEERRHTPHVLVIYSAIVILHVRRNLSVQEVCLPLAKLVQDLSCHRGLFYLIRQYIENLDAILNSSKSYSLGQQVLLGSWIATYIKKCPYNDLCYFLNILISNIRRIRDAGAWPEWDAVFHQHVLTNLKPIAVSDPAPVQLGELAALIEPNPSSELVFAFTADSVAPKVACHFVDALLENVVEGYTPPKSQETAILHVWVRCCLLKCENNEKLARNVMKLSALSVVMDELPRENPLVFFIKALSKHRGKLTSLCEQCFGKIDVWVVHYLKNPSNEAVVLYIYTCMSLLIFHCAALLYNKTRSNCLLSRLINTFLLPTDVLMGKSPHLFVLKGIQRTWHLFAMGVFSLDSYSDAFLERTLRDMVVKYVILLPADDFPILSCMSQEKLLVFILEKLSAAFLSRSCKSSEHNTVKALKIVQTALRNATGTFGTGKIILQTVLTAVLEVIMFHPPKSAAIEIVKFVSSNDPNGDFRACLRRSLKTVTEKHLAFNTNNYFQFTNILVKIIPRDIQAVLPDIKNHVGEVERMRGVGFDITLRQGLDRLELQIKNVL